MKLSMSSEADELNKICAGCGVDFVAPANEFYDIVEAHKGGEQAVSNSLPG